MSRLVSLTLALLLLSGCFALPFSVFPAAAQGQTAEITLSKDVAADVIQKAIEDRDYKFCGIE